MPPPSDRHAAAEAAFARVVATVVAHMDFGSSLCDTVQALDEQVHCGYVRRQAAAVIGSGTSHVLSFSYKPSTLLRCVLQANKHKSSPCSCLDTVLAWGCCPTVVMSSVTSTGHHPDGQSLTAVAVAQRDCWVRSLLNWGSLPWDLYHVREGAFVCSTLQKHGHNMGQETRAGMPRAQGQWRRWHGRRCRQLWVKIV
jgi:hypothetical protein